MGNYVSPFGNNPAPSDGSRPRSTNYISPFEGSQYTEDYWKKRQQEDQQRQSNDNKKRAADALVEAQKRAQQEKDKSWIEKGLEGVKKAFTTDLSKNVGDIVKAGAGLGKAMVVDPAVSLYKQANIGAANQAGVSPEAVANQAKFLDSQVKTGAITQQEADKRKAKNQKLAEQNKVSVQAEEKKQGVKQDQSAGALALLDTVSNASGLGAVGKTVFVKAAEAASKRLGRDLSMDELKNLTQQTKNALGEKYNSVRPGALEGFSKEITPTESISPDVTPEQFKGTFVNPIKAEVKSADSGAEAIGVRTPVKPGVKDVSTASSVEVRRPTVLSENDYNEQFSKLNRAYERDVKNLEGMPALRQKAASQAIEEKYSTALAKLDDDFNNPKLPEGTSKVKQIGKTKTEVTQASGGTPKGFVNTTGEMNDLERTLFTSAKNKAERRLGRPLKVEETDKIYDRTKKIAEEKGLNTPVSTVAPVEGVGRVRPDGPVVDKVTTLNEMPTTPKQETPRPKYEERTDGELRTSGNAARIEQVALEKKLTDKMSDLPQYKSINMKEQAKEAADLISTNKQQAIDIIDGKANPPGNLKAQSVHQALEDIAVREGDVELLTKLAKSNVNTELSESAQNLRIAAERDPHSAVEQIRQIRDARAKIAEKRSKTTVSNEAKDIRKKVEAATPKATKQDWNSFVKELTCR